MKRFKVNVTIDRPKGYIDAYGNRYPVNYGYVKQIVAGDGEFQDAYLLAEVPDGSKSFEGEVIAVIIRKNDQEDKWVVAPVGSYLTVAEIQQQVNFIERYFVSEVFLLESPREFKNRNV